MEQLPNTQPESSMVEETPAIPTPVTDNKFIQKMTTPSNSFIARLTRASSMQPIKTANAQEITEAPKKSLMERIIPGRTFNLSKTPEMVADEIHPVAHEIKNREKFNYAVRFVESSDDYTTKNKETGAMGAYQVMPQWLAPMTKKYLGREVSRKEFMSNPKIQDELFNSFMETHATEEGLRNAVSRWFLGKPYWYTMGGNEKKEIMRDGNGLTAEDYWNKVKEKYMN